MKLATGCRVVGACNSQAPAGEAVSFVQQVRKESTMSVQIKWLGHATFRISDDVVVYIDPWKLQDAPKDADIVLVSHSHYDHYSAADVEKAGKDGCQLIASSDVIASHGSGQAILSDRMGEVAGVTVKGVPAYNPQKQFHPRGNNWLGFVVAIGGKNIYYAGDTDVTDEMAALEDIDVALLPVGGTYTMDASQAADAVRHIKPKAAIPYHWGDIVGGRADADEFAAVAGACCDVVVLTPGQTMTLQ